MGREWLRLPDDHRAMSCPLCGGTIPADSAFHLTLPGPRRCHRCPHCFLLHVDEEEALDPARERERYLLHRNDAEDEGYVRFLLRLADPALRFVPPGTKGLDYGCGESAVLASLVRARGRRCDAFDPYFHPEPPTAPYGFLLAAEVFEHFRRPGEEIERLLALIAPGGILGVMTERWSNQDAVARWHYVSDPTHVAFYHERTFDWIGRRHALELLHRDAERVTVFRLPPAPASRR